MIRRVFTIICIVAWLPSCAMIPSQIQTEPPIPASLTAPCPPLPPLTKNSCEGAVEMIIEMAGMYHECAAKQVDLSRVITTRNQVDDTEKSTLNFGLNRK